MDREYIPILAQAFITAILHGPHRMMRTFVNIQHLSPILGITNIQHLTRTDCTPTMIIKLITYLLHLQHVFTADWFIATFIKRILGLLRLWIIASLITSLRCSHWRPLQSFSASPAGMAWIKPTRSHDSSCFLGVTCIQRTRLRAFTMRPLLLTQPGRHRHFPQQAIHYLFAGRPSTESPGRLTILFPSANRSFETCA